MLVIFKKILAPSKLHEIISLLLEREEIKGQTEKFEKDLHVIQKTDDEFKILLDELTKEFGHMPTTRQFESKIEEKTMQKQFIQKYNGKYILSGGGKVHFYQDINIAKGIHLY